jgi:hypothetical protein
MAQPDGGSVIEPPPEGDSAGSRKDREALREHVLE